jgi:hypothetical protein
MNYLILILLLITTPVNAEFEKCIRGDFCKTYKYNYEYYRDKQQELRRNQREQNKLNLEKLKRKWQKNNTNLREF